MNVGLIEKLERKSWSEKVKHFARKDAFLQSGKPGEPMQQLRLPKQGLPKLTPTHLTIANGHITRMAYPVIGRPCFGIPTARLVHGQDAFKKGKNGNVYPTRCGGCPVRVACAHVVERRLNRTTQEVRDAYDEVLNRGGANKVFDSHYAGGVRAPLAALVKALQEADLTSVNDKEVADHYDRQRAVSLRSDAERKRAKRQQPKATLGPDAMATLKAEFRSRVKRLEQAKVAGMGARGMQKAPKDWPTFAGTVWLTQAMLEASRQKVGPQYIAKEMQRRFPKSFGAQELGALRERVRRALPLMADLESLQMPDGSPCWQSFNAANLPSS